MGALTGFAIGLQEQGGASESSGSSSSSSSSSSGPSSPSRDFDHTYVHSEVGDRWGCYGRDEGGSEICSGGGRHRIRTAKCLSDPSGTAGIVWGVTGTCHQCANRILHPAGVTVSRARGYAASCLHFGGAFGEPTSWLNNLGRCRLGRFPLLTDEEWYANSGALTPTAEELRYNQRIWELYETASVDDPQLSGKDLELLIELLCGPDTHYAKVADLQNRQVELNKERHALVAAWYGNELTMQQYARNSNSLLENALRDFERRLGEDKYINMFKAPPASASQLLTGETNFGFAGSSTKTKGIAEQSDQPEPRASRFLKSSLLGLGPVDRAILQQKDQYMCQEFSHPNPKSPHIFYELAPSRAIESELAAKTVFADLVELQRTRNDIVLAKDPRTLTVIATKEIVWQAIVIWIATKLAEKAVGAIFDRLSGTDIVDLSAGAMRDVANLVRNAVDAAFLRHYTHEIDGVANKLLTYRETSEQRKLDEAESICDTLIPHLKSFGVQSLGGFMMAANLHLIAIQAKSKHVPEYAQTYTRLAAEYANYGIARANEIRQRIETRVGNCECRSQNTTHAGLLTTCSLQVDHGRRESWSNYDDADRTHRDCVSRRESELRAIVQDVQTLVNPIVETCVQWTR